jgi:hypothetical protein
LPPPSAAEPVAARGRITYALSQKVGRQAAVLGRTMHPPRTALFDT